MHVTRQLLATGNESLSFVRGENVLLVRARRRRLDDSAPRGETYGAPAYVDPAWSPDGRCLAVTHVTYSSPDDEADYVEVKHPTGTLELLPGESAISGAASWAPDGRRLVLVGYQIPDQGGGLYIEGIGTRAGAALTPERFDEPYDDAPAWSPDGSWIAFSRYDKGVSRLYLIRPDGKRLHRLTRTAGRNPSWSPDGKRLVFDDGRRVAVVGVDGKGLRYLTRGRDYAVDPAWSLDGRTIAYVRSPFDLDPLEGNIWVTTPEGSAPQLYVVNGVRACLEAGLSRLC